MSTITREAEAVQAPEEPPVEDAAPASEPERPCAECGAALAPDQDWCLECGKAQPDRAGARPSWRTAAAVLATTGVLVSGAVAAAYAGLSADAKKAAAPNAQAALPPQPAPAATPPAATTPPAPATPAPATPPPTTATPPAAATPKPTPPVATPKPAPKPAAAKPTTTKPKATKPKPTTTTPTAKPRTAPPGPLTAIKLAPEAAATYNPYARPDTDFTDAKLTLDGDKTTSWTAGFGGGDQSLVGVVLDLGKSKGVRALQLATSTPGMTIEVYGARGAQPPVSVQDPAWDHVATQLDVAPDGRIRLGDGTKKYRWVLVWPTEGPAGGTQVAISELKAYT